MQAVFAHVLMRLGARILEINAQGHPDIRAAMRDNELLVQVKTTAHRSSATLFQFGSEDISGITAKGRRQGLLAVLDCAQPAQWIVVENERASALVGQQVHLATLQAISNPEVSADCTTEFMEIVTVHEMRILNLTYGIMRVRALSHAPL